MRKREIIIDTIRRSPVGSLVMIGRSEYEVRAFAPSKASRVLCDRCDFRHEGLGARHCPYSAACLGRYREDRESVVFVRKGRKAR